jgi:LPXTG-motif cell wall-anchored protein
MRTATGAALGAALLLVLSTSPATASDSAGSMPYAVLPAGLQLPEGDAFTDGGHVNIQYTVDGASYAAGIHFESVNGQASGVFIGESYLPWSALVPEPEYCVTWVQIDHYSEHFGAEGEEPVCSDGSAPSEPSEPVAPGPQPAVPADPAPPTGPASPAEPEAPVEPEAPADPPEPARPDPEEPAEVADPTAPSGTVTPAGTAAASGRAGAAGGAADVLADAARAGTAGAGAERARLDDATTASEPAAPQGLPATGASAAGLAAAGGALAAGGVVLLAARRWRRAGEGVSASSSR